MRDITENTIMEASNTSTRQDWVIFFISLAVMIGFFIYADEWFWLALPFVLTYFVRALRMM
ncbi:MAG: hypothetical protein RL181_1814 [Bacteroidota bacterium]